MEDKIIPDRILDTLEEMIFNQEELDDLKKKSDRVGKGQFKPVELRKAILAYKVTLFERMQIFLKYNLNLWKNESHNSEDLELKAKFEENNRMLQERNELLESLGTRIANVCTKMKSYLEN